MRGSLPRSSRMAPGGGIGAPGSTGFRNGEAPARHPGDGNPEPHRGRSGQLREAACARVAAAPGWRCCRWLLATCSVPARGASRLRIGGPWPTGARSDACHRHPGRLPGTSTRRRNRPRPAPLGFPCPRLAPVPGTRAPRARNVGLDGRRRHRRHRAGSCKHLASGRKCPRAAGGFPSRLPRPAFLLPAGPTGPLVAADVRALRSVLAAARTQKLAPGPGRFRGREFRDSRHGPLAGSGLQPRTPRPPSWQHWISLRRTRTGRNATSSGAAWRSGSAIASGMRRSCVSSSPSLR